MVLNEKQKLYVRSMGKLLRVTAIFTDDDAANEHMDKSTNNDAVVAVFGGVVLLADKNDYGRTVIEPADAKTLRV